MKSAHLTEGLKIIGTRAFQASGLSSISIPSSVTTFGSYAFGFCPSLASAALADGLMVIGDNAFRASGLTSITIPASVTTIRGYAFESCGSLAEVVCRATAQPTLGTDAFTSIAAGAALYVPAAYVSDYEGGDWNSYFLGRIAAIP